MFLPMRSSHCKSGKPVFQCIPIHIYECRFKYTQK
uniref:Uncharacterized protein n=1 Tax=Rhizophora mucronata TaxID=61149 RepID=A0A2P2P5X5_RHIMU